MKNKIMFSIICMVLLISFASAAIETLGTFKQGENIELLQSGSNFTFCNITSVRYPINNSILIEDIQMTKDNIEYNYTLSTTSVTSLGRYIVNGFCSNSTTDIVWAYDFFLTEGGEEFGLPQAIMILGFFGLMGLFFGIGLTFKKEKWKLRSFFFICSLLMGIIFLNSIRIIIGTSTSLATMGSIGLILGIVILSFMFLYSFINYTIEAFKYFKEKRRMKWNI